MSCVDESVGKTVEMSRPAEQASETASKQVELSLNRNVSTRARRTMATGVLAFCFSLSNLLTVGTHRHEPRDQSRPIPMCSRSRSRAFASLSSARIKSK